MRRALHPLDARVGDILAVAEVDVRGPPERGEAEPDLRVRHAHNPMGQPHQLDSSAVPSLQAELLVIGGGATGAGVAWDAALRGFDVVLVDRADLAEGTSGRFHGLLHSGAAMSSRTRWPPRSASRRTRSCAA